MKTIQLSDETYALIRNLTINNETASEVVHRVVRQYTKTVKISLMLGVGNLSVGETAFREIPGGVPDVKFKQSVRNAVNRETKKNGKEFDITYRPGVVVVRRTR